MPLFAPPPAGQEGQDLNGFAEAHVVGQASAEAELAEEIEPAEAVLLVRAERADEGFGGFLGGDAAEIAELGAEVLEGGIDGGMGLGFQQHIEHAGLGPREADGLLARSSLDGGAGLHDDAVLGEPFLREDAEGAVGEFDEVLALAGRGQQAREGHGLVAELDGAGEIEPVDAGGDGHAEIGGGAVQLAFGLDDPAFADERGHDGREQARAAVRSGFRGFRDRLAGGSPGP